MKGIAMNNFLLLGACFPGRTLVNTFMTYETRKHVARTEYTKGLRSTSMPLSAGSRTVP